jgi:hypothetical protein
MIGQLSGTWLAPGAVCRWWIESGWQTKTGNWPTTGRINQLAELERLGWALAEGDADG